MDLFCPRCDGLTTGVGVDGLMVHLMDAHEFTQPEAAKRAAEVERECQELEAERAMKAGIPPARQFQCPDCPELKPTIRMLTRHLVDAHGYDPVAAQARVGMTTIVLATPVTESTKEETPMPVPKTPWHQRACGGCGKTGHRRDHCPERKKPAEKPPAAPMRLACLRTECKETFGTTHARNAHMAKHKPVKQTPADRARIKASAESTPVSRVRMMVAVGTTPKGLLALVQEELAALRPQVVELETVERFLLRMGA